jgi:hypothetical protein
MRHVRQRDDDACGVATIAMISGKPYELVESMLNWGKRDHVTLPMMVRTLWGFEVRCTKTFRKGKTLSRKELPFDAVINFVQPRGNRFWDSHWAAWDKSKGLLDPDPIVNRKKRPFRFLRIVPSTT